MQKWYDAMRCFVKKGKYPPFADREEDCCEGQSISKAYVRKVQGNQEKGHDPYHLRESEAQAETGLISFSKWSFAPKWYISSGCSDTYR